MEKYSCLRDLVKTVADIELIEAPAASDTQILYAYDPNYLIKILEGKLSPPLGRAMRQTNTFNLN
jgi:hypothetical protein